MRARNTGATRVLIAVASVSMLTLALFVQTAGAGLGGGLSAPLTVVKVVDPAHPAPPGTTFTATIHCDDTIIDPGTEPTANTEIEGLDTATVTFDATGQPTTPDTIGFIGPGVCTVTETATGGAATVSYACEGVQGTIDDAPIKESFGGPSSSDVLPPVCATTGPVDPIEVNISEPDQSATVTITNTFAAPQIAPQIVAQPAFTG
jgi:hypothetical protein